MTSIVSKNFPLNLVFSLVLILGSFFSVYSLTDAKPNDYVNCFILLAFLFSVKSLVIKIRDLKAQAVRKSLINCYLMLIPVSLLILLAPELVMMLTNNFLFKEFTAGFLVVYFVLKFNLLKLLK